MSYVQKIVYRQTVCYWERLVFRDCWGRVNFQWS